MSIEGTCVSIGDCDLAFPPAEATLFVSEQFGPAQLDSTHFLTVAEALTVASSGEVIAIGPGDYREPLTLSMDVKLIGQCPGLANFVGPDFGNQSAIEVTAGTVEVSGLTFVNWPGAIFANGGAVVLEDSRLEYNWNVALLATGAGSSIVARRSAIRFTDAGPSEEFGVGAGAVGGGFIRLEQVEVADNVGTGIYIYDVSSRVEIDESLIWRTALTAAGGYGHGLEVKARASAEVSRSVFAENHSMEIEVWQQYSELVLTDSVLRDTRPNGRNEGGFGILVHHSGTATLERVSLLRTQASGIEVMDPDSRGTIVESAFIRTPLAPGNSYSSALQAERGAQVVARKVALISGSHVSVYSGGSGSRLQLDDSLIKDTMAMVGTPWGLGGLIDNGGALRLNRTTVTGSAGVGLAVMHPSSSILADATLVEGTRWTSPSPPDLTFFPAGVDLGSGSSVTCRNCVLRGNNGVGFSAGADPSGNQAGRATFTDSWFGPGETDPAGIGMVVFPNSEVTVESSTFRGNAMALVVSGAGASLAASDTTAIDEVTGRGPEATAFVAQAGGILTGTSVVARSEGKRGAFVQGPGSQASFQDSLFGGGGVLAQEGASLELIGCEVSNAEGLGVGATHGGTDLYLDQSVVRGTVLDDEGVAYGVATWGGATSTVSRTSSLDNEAVGFAVISGASRMAWSDAQGNPVGLQATGGCEVVTIDPLPETPDPNTVYLSGQCSFQLNEEPRASGALNVPSIVAGPIEL